MNRTVTVTLEALGNKEELSNFRKSVIKKNHLDSRHAIYCFNERLLSTDTYIFDFNSIVEMPIQLNLTASPLSLFMMKLFSLDKNMLLTKVPGSPYALPKVIQALHLDYVTLGKITVGEYIRAVTLLKDIDPRTFHSLFGEYLEDGQQLFMNQRLYVFTNCHDWCKHYWGSTHNAFDARFFDADPIYAQSERLKVEFKTDEKVTKVLFERMAELFPGIRFFITYTYSDGSESGHIELKKQVVCYVRSGNNEAKFDAH